MTNLQNGHISDLLNNSMKYNPEIIALGYAILQEKQRILALATRTRLMALIEAADEKTLDYLAVELRTKAYGFTVDYSVNDADGNTVNVTEAIDGAVKRTFSAVLGQNYSLQITGETFMRILNGKRTLTITANDGKAATVHTLTFTKEVTRATVTLDKPMEADGEITLAILSVIGSIPTDAKYTVEVTNNGKDAQPVWQDVTAEVKSGANIVFTNHTAANGFAFNFKVSVERGGSGVGGYITSVQGGFQ